MNKIELEKYRLDSKIDCMRNRKCKGCFFSKIRSRCGCAKKLKIKNFTRKYSKIRRVIKQKFLNEAKNGS